MTYDLAQQTLDEFQRLNSEESCAVLLNIVLSVSTVATVRAALCDQRTSSISFQGVNYRGANFTKPSFSLNSDNRLETIEIGMSTVDPFIATMVHRLRGLHDAPVRIYWITEAYTATANAAKTLDAIVLDCVETYGSATFTLGRPDLTAIGLPRDVYNADGCVFQLGGRGCRFQFPTFGQIGYGDPTVMTCTNRHDGIGGCVHHGDNEVARMNAGQLPFGARLHPANFGAQRALPVQR